MEISVLKGNDEIELKLARASSSTSDSKRTELFIAHSEEFPDCKLTFKVRSGKIKSLAIFGDITIYPEDLEMTRLVLMERAQEALNEFLESEATGIDGGKDDNNAGKIKPYDPNQIKVRQDKYALDYVVNTYIKDNIFDLNTDFQRRFVWDRKRQSRLIESIMLGIPIPVMYLSESLDEQFHVVDGLQRLTTFNSFLKNQFPLKNLEHLKQYEGCYFSELAGPDREHLDKKMRTRIESYQLYFNIIEKTSPNEVKYDIFERLNTGGLPLNAQEIRNCNALAHVRDFLKNASTSDEFKLATDKSISSKRMDDQELILRFTGFYLHRENKLLYTGNMKYFLDSVNEYLNESSKEYIDEIYNNFINSMKICRLLFGKFAFRKCLPTDLVEGARRPSINKAMFVVWSVLTTRLNYNNLAVQNNEGFLTNSLADLMVDRIESRHTSDENFSDYYNYFTKGTFDLRTIFNSFRATEDFLKHKGLMQ